MFVVIIILMSFALIGIVIIQGYWIKTAVDDKDEAFSYTIHQVLSSVSETLEQNEINKYIARIVELREADSLLNLKDPQLREFMFVQENKNTKETFIYRHGVLEEDYSLPTNVLGDFGGDDDTTVVRNYISRQSQKIVHSSSLDGNVGTNTIDSYEIIGRLPAIDKMMIEETLRNSIERLPIVDRVSVAQLELLLRQELLHRKLDIDFEYAVYTKGVLSNVRSKFFDTHDLKEYRVPLFAKASGESSYELALVVPGREQFLMSSIIGIASLSIVFTIIIIVTFTITVNQLITQRKISEIKTDFINNMTHEFKTPIATINLVLDAIKNPATLSNPDKVMHYVGMLREENKRMHSQVENILRISKLEKGELDIDKEPLDAHSIIETAIAHVQLLVDDRGGVIRQHLYAENSDILANESHFTNVMINVIENAIKYSPEAPEIDVYTENVDNHIIIKVQDRGQGMSKAVLRKVFDKFYREHTGNLHNVKGHGLGLAYVKSIIKDHNGIVFAESEKGKGSTFFIKLRVL